jgi:hypothetical protein
MTYFSMGEVQHSRYITSSRLKKDNKKINKIDKKPSIFISLVINIISLYFTPDQHHRSLFHHSITYLVRLACSLHLRGFCPCGFATFFTVFLSFCYIVLLRGYLDGFDDLLVLASLKVVTTVSKV